MRHNIKPAALTPLSAVSRDNPCGSDLLGKTEPTDVHGPNFPGKASPEAVAAKAQISVFLLDLKI